MGKLTIRTLAGASSVLLIIVVLLSPYHPRPARAEYPTITIRFSDVAGIGQDNWPTYRNYVDRTGYIINDHVMVKLSDLAQILEANVQQIGWRYLITRNGQTIEVYLDDTRFYTSVSYSLVDRQTGEARQYSHSWSGQAQVPAQMIGGYTYVQLGPIAHSLGVLVMRYNTAVSPARVDVFDFRINRTTPWPDSNTYVVGGQWLKDWESKGSTPIAPHFVLSEYWERKTNISSTYQKQIKASVTALQSLENVRYLMGNVSFSPTSAFRSWEGNLAAGSNFGRSWHMRGRAWDAGDKAWYDKVYEDISPVEDAAPYAFWRTGNPNSVSQCYEIEKMPQDGLWWLHCQREPGSDADSEP